MVLCDLLMLIVIVVYGFVVGVGMSFVLMGDMVCVLKQGYFFQVFVCIGFVFDGGVIYLFLCFVGLCCVVEFLMFVDKFFVEQVFEWGFINRVFDD